MVVTRHASAAEGIRDWLRLASVPGLGSEGQRKLLQAFGLPEAIFAASFSELAAVIGHELAQSLQHHNSDSDVESGLRWLAEQGNHIVTLADAEYPQALLEHDSPPIVLYAKGRIELLNRPAIAVVGSRNATRQGEINAEAFSDALASAGVSIVSGLALGIDTAAHRGGLKHAASTIAVIGTGADRIYPARNQDLARCIAERG